MAAKIVAVGEVLWDVFATERKLGGTTANFTLHAHGLGAEARLISRVGEDALGQEVLDLFRERGVPTDTIQIDSQAATGTVDVLVNADGQPSYRVAENIAWDFIAIDEAARSAVATADALCFGTLAQRSPRSRATILELLISAPKRCFRVFDVNRRVPYWSDEVFLESLALADVVKLNDEELAVISPMLNLPADERAAITILAERYRLKLVALTRGSRGSLLFANGEWAEYPSISVNVKDTVGAGDSFAAALVIGFLAGWPLERIGEHASAVAAYVCTQAGATPILPADLRAKFE